MDVVGEVLHAAGETLEVALELEVLVALHGHPAVVDVQVLAMERNREAYLVAGFKVAVGSQVVRDVSEELFGDAGVGVGGAVNLAVEPRRGGIRREARRRNSWGSYCSQAIQPYREGRRHLGCPRPRGRREKQGGEERTNTIGGVRATPLSSATQRAMSVIRATSFIVVEVCQREEQKVNGNRIGIEKQKGNFIRLAHWRILGSSMADWSLKKKPIEHDLEIGFLWEQIRLLSGLDACASDPTNVHSCFIYLKPSKKQNYSY